MNIVVEYPTKEKKSLGKGVFTDIYSMALLEPIKIISKKPRKPSPNRAGI